MVERYSMGIYRLYAVMVWLGKTTYPLAGREQDIIWALDNYITGLKPTKQVTEAWIDVSLREPKATPFVRPKGLSWWQHVRKPYYRYLLRTKSTWAWDRATPAKKLVYTAWDTFRTREEEP